MAPFLALTLDFQITMASPLSTPAIWAFSFRRKDRVERDSRAARHRHLFPYI